MTIFIRAKELTRVFTPSGSNFSAKIARLGPLYEDLRIETFGIAEDEIPAMDQLDVNYRPVYFLRRSIATLLEFAEAIRHIEESPDFSLVARGLAANPKLEQYWIKASKFFDRKDEQLRRFRNDFGGHFGLEAARWAILNVDRASTDGIEVGKLLYLRFAGEIVATAMQRQGSGSNREQKIRNLIATRCVHCLVTCYLWEKFG
jgi:hypothetical protein